MSDTTFGLILFGIGLVGIVAYGVLLIKLAKILHENLNRPPLRAPRFVAELWTKPNKEEK